MATTWKRVACWAASICVRSATCRPASQSQEVLKLAIEQYEQIVKLDPKSVEDHLLLGRLVPPEQRAAEVGGRIQDGGQDTAGFGRSRHHAGLPLQRRRRFLARAAGAERDSGSVAHREAVLRSGLHLRAAEGLQEGDRRLSARRPNWTTTTWIPCAAWRRT